MSHRHAIALAAIAGALSVGASPAAAKTLKVDDDHAQCPSATFTSIQDAVTAAQPGDKVQVCPGTYTEQVTIDGKDKLKLESQRPRQAIIRYPATPTTGPLVHIHNSDDVDVRQFVITGPYNAGSCAAGEHRGVFVDDSFRADIVENQVTEIRDVNPALRGCQDGLGVLVGRQFENTTGSADVSHNTIDTYQKGGVVVDNDGSDAHVDHNTVVGNPGDQPYAAINGIQVSRGATAHVDHNDVSDNVFTGDKTLAIGTGILLFQLDGDVQVDHNDTHDNDDNLSLNDADNTVIDHNTSLRAIVFDGLFADSDSSGNLFDHNVAQDNTEHDCHDDSTGSGTAGTANTWKDDRGDTENRPGLCEPNRP